MSIWSNIYRHHRWSNRVLIDFLAGLTGEQLELSVPGTYGGSLATIRHVVSADADYLRIIPAAPEVRQISDHGHWGGWDELRSIAWEAGSALVDHVDGLTDDAFLIDDDAGEPRELTVPSCSARSFTMPPTTERRSRPPSRPTGSSPPISACGAGGGAKRVARSSSSYAPNPDPSGYEHPWFAVLRRLHPRSALGR